MTIEIPKEACEDAIESIERYFKENLTDCIEEKLANVSAGGLLDFFIE